MKPRMIIVFFLFLLMGLVGCESSNNKVNSLGQENLKNKTEDQLNLNNRGYYILYTSFEETKSSLFLYKNKNKLDVTSMGGLFTVDGKPVYKSGLYGTNQSLSEKNMKKDFLQPVSIFRTIIIY